MKSSFLRGLLVALVGLALFASPLVAADMQVKNPPGPGGAASVPYKWDGGYLGIYAGGEQGKSSTSVDGWTDKIPVQRCYTKYEGESETPTEYCRNVRHQYVKLSYPGVSNNGNVIGVALGAYLGYNKQINSAMVVGVELDGGYSGARDNEVIYAVTSSHKMPWNMHLRGRLGFLPTTNQDTMLYLAGGLVVKQQKTELSGPGGVASESKTKAGWTVGLGAEHKFTQRLSGRIEGGWDKVTDQTVCIPGACTTLNGGSLFARAGLSVSF